MSVPNIIQLTKLQKYANNDIFVNFVFLIKSVNSVLYLNEGGYEEPSLAPIDDIYNKNACYLAALKNLGISQNNTEQITEFDTTPCPPDTFYSNWAQYIGSTRFDRNPKITIEP